MDDISLIKNWHEKAKDDYFSRYTFQYLSLEAFLKKYKYSTGDVSNFSQGRVQERGYIQLLKNESNYNFIWSEILSIDLNFNNLILELVEYLNKEPLNVKNVWWNNNTNKPKTTSTELCVLNTEEDFSNMVEFWYQIRNNFFHANKNPNSERDNTLIFYALSTLSYFMENVCIAEIDNRTFNPATWESFEHRFFNGEAELSYGSGEHKPCANVFEILFLDDSQFPIIIEQKTFDKKTIIEKLGNILCGLYGAEPMMENFWKRISYQAWRNGKQEKLEEYFKEYLPLIKDELGEECLTKY